jgi:HD superfamily phosphodiesterase
MKEKIFQQIIKDSKNKVKGLARQNGWLWFYNIHQKEVIKFAHKLLEKYKEANKQIVLIACWLHDIAHYYAKDDKEILRLKKKHHLNGARIAGELLKNYDIDQKEIEQIKSCVLRHRNHEPYQAETLEEKIVVAADTLSHFGSIFYFTYFKFHPTHSLERMVKDDLAKTARDWRDLQVLPEAREMVETEYKTIRKLLENYNRKEV